MAARPPVDTSRTAPVITGAPFDKSDKKSALLADIAGMIANSRPRCENSALPAALSSANAKVSQNFFSRTSAAFGLRPTAML